MKEALLDCLGLLAPTRLSSTHNRLVSVPYAAEGVIIVLQEGKTNIESLIQVGQFQLCPTLATLRWSRSCLS